jgi:hypothetical protein
MSMSLLARFCHPRGTSENVAERLDREQIGTRQFRNGRGLSIAHHLTVFNRPSRTTIPRRSAHRGRSMKWFTPPCFSRSFPPFSVPSARVPNLASCARSSHASAVDYIAVPQCDRSQNDGSADKLPDCTARNVHRHIRFFSDSFQRLALGAFLAPHSVSGSAPLATAPRTALAFRRASVRARPGLRCMQRLRPPAR